MSNAVNGRRRHLIWSVTLAIGQVALSLIGPAAAAQDFVGAERAIRVALDNQEDPYDSLCGDLIPTSGQMLCRMKAPYANIMLSGCNTPADCGDEDDGVMGEYKIMRKLNKSDVTSAEVGPTWVDKLPCRDEDADWACGGFLEERLAGHELKLWEAVSARIENIGDEQCAKDYDRVFKAISWLVENAAAFGEVRKLNKGQSAVFVDDMNRISLFGTSKGAINDLQGFLQVDGAYVVFDPMPPLSKDKNSIQGWIQGCFENWTCAIAAQVADRHDLKLPSCLD